ncbi:MAG: histidine kinase N-terminal 7TM domain-containing protein [Thermoplasmata archaeon]
MLTWYAVPPAVSAVIFAFLIICFAKLRKNIHYSAFLYALFFFLWSLGEFVERIAGPPPEESEIALLGLRIIAIAGSFLPAALIHFACEFPVRRVRVPRIVFWLLYAWSAFVALVSVGTNLLVEGLIVYQPGWGADFGIGIALWGTYIIVGTIVAIALLEKSSFALQSTGGREQARIMGVALAISLCCAATTGYLPPLFGIEDIYPLTTIPFAITGLLILHSVLKYHRVILLPIRLELGKKIEVGYFWCEDREYARRHFLENTKEASNALFVSSEQKIPEEIQKLAKVIVVAKDGDIDPMDEEKMRTLTFLIEKFLSQEEKALVLLEGFDELLAHYFYSTISVPQLLEEIKKCAKPYGAKIICTFNRGILEDWQIEEIKKGGERLR